jgi:predicted O-methyltransferase YrrM
MTRLQGNAMTSSNSVGSDEEFVRRCYRTVLGREADAAGLRHFVGALRTGSSRLAVLQEFLETDEHKSRLHAAWRFAPPGHYYSPIPSDQDIEAFARRDVLSEPLEGIDLNEAEQRALLEHLAALYASMPFVDEPRPGFRYRFVNPSYSYADAIFLHTMLRHVQPKRLIEIGSGFSTAVTLDTNELFLGGNLECCFIEPYPELLKSLMKADDHRRATIIAKPLQDVELTVFDQLQSGDVLFIDSTHVSKVNSDVNRIVFEILPRLEPGTFVHIHDVFYPFEYPVAWLREGRAWNEQYVLRAFLQFNSAFKIRLFGDYITRRHGDWFRRHMPLCLNNTGGALWLERI